MQKINLQKQDTLFLSKKNLQIFLKPIKNQLDAGFKKGSRLVISNFNKESKYSFKNKKLISLIQKNNELITSYDLSSLYLILKKKKVLDKKTLKKIKIPSVFFRISLEIVFNKESLKQEIIAHLLEDFNQKDTDKNNSKRDYLNSSLKQQKLVLALDKKVCIALIQKKTLQLKNNKINQNKFKNQLTRSLNINQLDPDKTASYQVDNLENTTLVLPKLLSSFRNVAIGTIESQEYFLANLQEKIRNNSFFISLNKNFSYPFLYQLKEKYKTFNKSTLEQEINIFQELQLKHASLSFFKRANNILKKNNINFNLKDILKFKKDSFKIDIKKQKLTNLNLSKDTYNQNINYLKKIDDLLSKSKQKSALLEFLQDYKELKLSKEQLVKSKNILEKILNKILKIEVNNQILLNKFNIKTPLKKQEDIVFLLNKIKPFLHFNLKDNSSLINNLQPLKNKTDDFLPYLKVFKKYQNQQEKIKKIVFKENLEYELLKKNTLKLKDELIFLKSEKLNLTDLKNQEQSFVSLNEKLKKTKEIFTNHKQSCQKKDHNIFNLDAKTNSLLKTSLFFISQLDDDLISSRANFYLDNRFSFWFESLSRILTKLKKNKTHLQKLFKLDILPKSITLEWHYHNIKSTGFLAKSISRQYKTTKNFINNLILNKKNTNIAIKSLPQLIDYIKSTEDLKSLNKNNNNFITLFSGLNTDLKKLKKIFNWYLLIQEKLSEDKKIKSSEKEIIISFINGISSRKFKELQDLKTQEELQKNIDFFNKTELFCNSFNLKYPSNDLFIKLKTLINLNIKSKNFIEKTFINYDKNSINKLIHNIKLNENMLVFLKESEFFELIFKSYTTQKTTSDAILFCNFLQNSEKNLFLEKLITVINKDNFFNLIDYYNDTFYLLDDLKELVLTNQEYILKKINLNQDLTSLKDEITKKLTAFIDIEILEKSLELVANIPLLKNLNLKLQNDSLEKTYNLNFFNSIYNKINKFKQNIDLDYILELDENNLKDDESQVKQQIIKQEKKVLFYKKIYKTNQMPNLDNLNDLIENINQDSYLKFIKNNYKNIVYFTKNLFLTPESFNYFKIENHFLKNFLIIKKDKLISIKNASYRYLANNFKSQKSLCANNYNINFPIKKLEIKTNQLLKDNFLSTNILQNYFTLYFFKHAAYKKNKNTQEAQQVANLVITFDFDKSILILVNSKEHLAEVYFYILNKISKMAPKKREFFYRKLYAKTIFVDLFTKTQKKTYDICITSFAHDSSYFINSIFSGKKAIDNFLDSYNNFFKSKLVLAKEKFILLSSLHLDLFSLFSCAGLICSKSKKLENFFYLIHKIQKPNFYNLPPLFKFIKDMYELFQKDCVLKLDTKIDDLQVDFLLKKRELSSCIAIDFLNYNDKEKQELLALKNIKLICFDLNDYTNQPIIYKKMLYDYLFFTKTNLNINTKNLTLELTKTITID